MSNRQVKTATVTFEPVTEHKPSPPSGWLLAFGVILPAIVIGIELVTHMCAQSFFDPMPTYWHVAAVAFVPACNLLIWSYLEYQPRWNARWVEFANGAAIAIAALYALLFLPLLPLAILAIVAGIGLLPLAPLAAFVSALRLRVALTRRRRGATLARPLIGGLVVGLVFVIALDVPPAATRIGIQMAGSDTPAERERGLTLLRTLGDDDLLLRLCYGAAGRPTGLLSGFVMLTSNNWIGDRSQRIASPAQAREIYYRLHGVAFNTKPAPFQDASRFADTQFDDDHGGTRVGGRVQGLTLASSRIDGSISGDDLVAYLEWTIEFKNSAAMDREARLQLALPPGGVVSRATLWVDGEEREAAYGGRGEVRAAYQQVAVVQRRDPLLVTTKGADRVLAQAFPVPRNGGTIKFKIGISAPLEITQSDQARLTLPALLDRNFSIGADTSHSIWIESRQALSDASGLNSTRLDSRLYRISGTLDDRTLSGSRQAITVDRSPNVASRQARLGDAETIVQQIARGEPTRTLMLVIDGSARLSGTATKIVAALHAIPAGTKVGAIIAGEPTARMPLGPWSDAQSAAISKLIRSASFSGGQDNAPALADALLALEAESQATLLWIHGPQPVSFAGSGARLEQATARLSRLPKVVLYSVEPGPNEVLPDAPWAWGARSLPQTGAIDADLAGFFARATGDNQVTRRQQGPMTADVITGSDHIARLWANERVLELMRTGGNRADAVTLASQYHLVTPVSGAVVLENKQQYDAARLTPVSQSSTPTVPTVPEPHEWALIIIACAAFTWLLWRHRQQQMMA
jgi:vault protein inter-alpha-trypsin-like protein